VVGKGRPVMLNPLPVRLACEMVTLAVPVFVIVSEMVELFPTCTLPNPTVLGFPLRVPPATADPVTVITRFCPPAVTVTVPLCAPAAVGLNAIWIATLCPAATLVGNVGEVMLKPPVGMVGCGTDTLLEVLFTMLSLRVAVWPTVTLPKSSVAFEMVTEPLGGGVLCEPP
jgi:hypothetical protein